VLNESIWDGDYRAARVGPWMQIAADTRRFKDRVKKTYEDIGWVFSGEHRARVYRERVLG